MVTTTIRMSKEDIEAIRNYCLNESLKGRRTSMNAYIMDAIKEKAMRINKAEWEK